MVVRRVLNRRTSGSLRVYVHHPNPRPVFKQTKRYSYSETPEAETYRNSREKFRHGIPCNLFIGLSWNQILHLIVLPGRMRYKRISRLKEDTPDFIVSLLLETCDISHIHPSPYFSSEDIKRLTLHGGGLPPSITLCPSLGKQTRPLRKLGFTSHGQ